MTSKFPTCFAAVLMTLTLPPVLVGQTTVNGQSPHHHYKLIDLGTFGGPSAYKSVNAPGYQILTNAGAIAFAADTPMPDPFSPNCYNPDCFVTHATQWKNGVLVDLGALGGRVNSSASGAINARGWIVGQSEDGEIDPISGLPEVHATLWRDQILDLGTFGGHWSVGLTLNDAGMSSDSRRIQFPIPSPCSHRQERRLARSGGEKAN